MDIHHSFNQAILLWYDQNRRPLAWRHSGPPDPYKVWLSEMMLQQTTTTTVTAYYKNFLKQWPTIHDLAQASLDEVLHAWQGLGYYARARNLHRCAQKIVDKFQGFFPANEQLLQTLPGIGPYSAAAIVSIAFEQPAVVLDTNIIRIISRVFAITGIIKLHTPAFKTIYHYASTVMSQQRPGDYAQGLMDLGALVCTAKNPKCLFCPLRSFCQAFAQGIQESLPNKPLKGVRPVKTMAFWVIFNDQQQLAFVKRPNKGLLGGLMVLPWTFWDPVMDEEPPFPVQGQWQKLPEITHTFTHFTANVHIYCLKDTAPNFSADRWCSLMDLHTLALPTIVKKALKIIQLEKNIF